MTVNIFQQGDLLEIHIKAQAPNLTDRIFHLVIRADETLQDKGLCFLRLDNLNKIETKILSINLFCKMYLGDHLDDNYFGGRVHRQGTVVFSSLLTSD